MANGIVLNIDTTKSEFQNPMVQLRQGDGNYQSLDVTVTSNGEPFDLTGWTITFMGTTAGGFKIIDSAVTVTNALQGEFTYTPTKAWGQDQGEFKNAYFKFTKADETASGASFRVNVLEAVDLTAEEAGNYISVVDVLINDIKTDMDNKLADTQKTLSDTQSQATTVQTNVNDLNTSVNELKSQNNNIKTSDNTWTGTNTFNKQIIAQAGVQGNIQGNAETATKLQTARLVGGVPFDGTSDITLPGVNVKGNQDTSGRSKNATNADHANNASSADLATKAIALQTPRKINGTNFGGTADINVNAANDNNLVHLVGNETIAGDKTFSGKLTITSGVPTQVQQSATIEFPMWYGSTMKATRFGNMVTLHYATRPTQDIPANTISSDSVPVGFRPNDWSFMATGVGVGGGGSVEIGTDGKLNVRGGVWVQYSHTMTATYFTGDAFPS